jgi:uncharacterized repeat protein (TIGR01451 family)
MTSSGKIHVRVGYKWIVTLLFAFAISLTATPAQAQSSVDCVADRGGVIDGFVNRVSPSQINIDGNCTIRNFSASNPLTSNISWYGNNPTSWLLIFDNVVFTGNMSCNLNSQGNRIWFVNGSTSTLKASCLNLLIPVEKINKQNPPGPATAAIGVPFTYKMTIPVLFDPATGTVSNANGSPNDLHGITVWDDLNATGADLSFVSERAYWLSNGTPVPHTFSNVGGALTFDNFPVVPAGQQFVIEVTVVLNDTPTNVPGKSFINTAKWDFGRLIGGVYYEPLPGEWGITPPMTIAAPVLTLTKSGPTTMNLGQWGNFAIDVRNTGTIDAFNATIRDVLPHGATGGMCDLTPEILSAQVFAADGVTPIAGKGPLSAGSGYSLNYSAAPACSLDLTILTVAGKIGPNERLIVRYRTQLDTNTQNGVALTNVAGAIQWFNGDSSVANRKASTRTLTNGTPGVLDHEDAHTVTAAVTGYFFDKTVADLTSGVNPAKTAAPGDKLRYTLRLRTTSQALSGFSIFDDMDALNATADFAPGTLTLVTTPAGADTSATNSTGGSKGTGVIDIRNLNLPVNSEAVIQFEITLKSAITNATVVTNQATARLANGTTFAVSDDPNVNGTADPNVSGDEDPTRVTIVSVSEPALVLRKSGPTTMNLGEWGNFTIDVQNTGLGAAWNATIRDLLPHGTTGGMCNLTPEILSAQVFAADGVTLVPGKGSLNSGSGYSLSYNAAPNCQLEMTVLTAAGAIGPNERLIIRYRTQLDTSTQNGVALTNIAGAIQWFNADSSNSNRQSYTRTLTNGTPGILDHEDAWTVTVALTGYSFDKTVANLTSGVNPATTAAPGDRLRYTLRFRMPNQTMSNFRIFDELDALNATAAFVPGTLTLVTYPAGADISATSSTGGTKGTGVLQVRNLNLPLNGEVLIQFDITLASTLSNGTVVANQSTLGPIDTINFPYIVPVPGTAMLLSDDPNVNGTASPTVPGDEDPTRVTIVAASDPALVLRKSGPSTMNLGQWGNFAIDVQNTGNGDAWNASIRDVLPDGATGGTCDLTPEILSAQVFAADGVTPISGKGPLAPGSGYSLSYSAAPNCRLEMTMLTTAGRIGPNERLIIRYRTQLDTDTQNGVTLTNVAGAIQWFNADSSNPSRQSYTRALTNGTPGVPDHEDAWTVTTALSGYLFEKTVADLTSGANPATTAAPGDKLRYTLRFRTTQAMSNFRIFDELDALNAQPDFAPGTLSLVASPAGADISATSSTGGTKGTGVIDIRTVSLPANGEALIQFDITLKSAITNGTVVTNQSAIRLGNGTTFALSDDPNVNGKADPAVSGDEDPTRVTIASAPAFRVQKISTDMTGDPNVLLAGETLRYTITVKNISTADAVNVMLRDAVPANTTYVANSTKMNGAAVTDVAGVSPLANGMPINSPANATPGSMPADASSNTANVATITFDVVVNPSVANGTVISNQGFVTATASGISDQPSDDPRTPAPNDPTRDIVGGVASFRVQKISTDLTGDPNVLLAGETLRYTITVKNISTTDAVNVMLRDAVPANATYVAGSTTLNGAAVTDVAGSSPLVNGMPINSPANTTAGSMPADASSTITFDVVVNANVANGTVISNQGFVSATGIADQPSDDPRTPAPNDPTQDIVGNRPSLYAEKRVVLFGDLGSPNIVDPGDVLRYTITIKNSAAIVAAGVVLKDAVPSNTTYVADSTLLNGSPVGQPDGGASPLASGINIGTISPDTTATLQYDLRINVGTPAGTLISNQAVVSGTGLPNLLTDGDGNPATGPEPTVVVVGAGQQLSISNQVTVVGGGAAVPGAQVEYVVNVVNTAAVPAFNVVITDDLNGLQPNQIAYVSPSATMNDAAAGVSFAGSMITANFASVNGPLAPGGVVVLKFRATLASNLAIGTVVTNTSVVAWNNPTQTASASASIVVGGVPGFSMLSGSLWHDANFDDARDSGERALTGWSVDLYRSGQVLQSAVTDTAGVYHIINVEPNDTPGSAAYELRFRAPGAGANTAMLGRAVSPFTNGLQRITNIVVKSGANLQDLNLPIHPNGVVYNSVARTPIAGATVTLLDGRGAVALPANCFDDTAQQGQITLADGYYKFDINFSDPACPSGGDYLIGVTAPAGSNYVAGYSQIIPPKSDASTAAFSVPACPASADDAIPGTAMFCEVQPSEFAPASSVPPRSAGTIYHVHVRLDGSRTPGTSQIFNNHISLDPQITGSLAISKTTPLLNVTRGQLVPYVITVNNPAGLLLNGVSIVDRLPAGFTYVEGSALLDGVPTVPSFAGGALSWSGLTIAGTEARTVKLLLAVGAGVSEGEYVNRAQAVNAAGNPMSGEATARVRVVADPTLDCTDVIGKVFNDANRNGLQDDGEDGLAGVRVVTARGLAATTDQFGRYHITCAITPNESRGSNFVLKLDDRTLPSGFRMSTDQVLIKSATRGQTLRLNFGASIFRVVGIDLSDAVFEPGTTDIRIQWRPRVNLLLDELRKAPAVLRLSYVADTEDASLVERRVEAIKRQLTESWNAVNKSYALSIEREVFWRRGAPPKRPDVRVPGSK